MRNTLLVAILLFASFVASACAARYEPPATALAAPASVTAADTTDASFEPAWWRQFQDPVLDTLMDRALVANRNLQAASARYEAVRSLAGAAALLHIPRGGAAVGVARQHLSAAEAPGLPSRTATFVETGFAAGWEADVFGRLRGIRRAAVADASVAAMDVRAVQVAIAAELATAYFELRGAERDLVLVDQLRQRTSDQLTIVRTLVTAGRVTRLDALRAQQVEDELAVARAGSQHRIERARNRLATLTGQAPDALQVPAPPAIPLRAAALAIGAPGDLLRRRPDIAAAELRVVAAAARANVARAELFPRVDVVGSVGLVAGSLGRLTDAAAGSWLIAPRLVWNALDWPRLRREMRAAGAMADAAFADYEQQVLQALEETRTALAAHAAANQQLVAHERRASTASDAARVVFTQYREGLVDSLARTEADRDAIAGALEANGALTAQRLAVVNLYRSLGGGWW